MNIMREQNEEMIFIAIMSDHNIKNTADSLDNSTYVQQEKSITATSILLGLK